ncbi:hypothetical protein H2200_006738 [Cladophialophora chaetospira]|uniref:Zn(2)-C6 fungal-type domain-containing protein n=1 Tax=Cladophialophora chaetospira TaxID=386627 RepID=A0AA39CHH1_9EURO|nr:hypothetical protein H2200_006738 [Cladophialophora chaetospira]
MQTQSPRQANERVSTACLPCRKRKVKCSGSSPCKDCLRLGKDSECVYAAVQRRKRKCPGKLSREVRQGPLATTGQRNCDFDGNNDRNAGTSLHQDTLQPECIPSELHAPTLLERDEWSYQEPWAWTSICSDPGSEWIQSKTGDRGFVAIAKRFTKDLVTKSSEEKRALSGTAPVEIDEALAREYVNAFYQNCWEADIGIIDRDEIEAKLESHYRSRLPKDEEAWFALRNIVFAGGCRSVLAKDHTSCVAAQAEANRFFQMALSVLTSLLLPPTSLMAVQALTLMACYSQSLGNPGFKNLLCFNAVQVAQSKGLHRQPDRAWGMSENAILKRNWLWWAIYTLDKHLALCSSRPSAIDDRNVSTLIPTSIPTGSSIQLHLHTIGVRHARIQSRVSRELLSFKALSLPAGELIRLVTDFSAELKQLVAEMPHEFEISTLATSSHSKRRVTQILYVHFSIWGTLMAVHAHFFYPWMASRFTKGTNTASPEIENQIVSSSAIVAEAARQILLALRLLNTSVTTPSWLAFDYPIYAAINLFIYILKYPTLASASADLGLLDVCAGHFGYIEFLTSSQVSISLPREAANVASKVVKAAKARALEDVSAAAAVGHDDRAIDPQDHVAGMEDLNFDAFDNSTTALNEFGDFLALDLSSWNLVSSFDMVNSSTSDFVSISP